MDPHDPLSERAPLPETLLWPERGRVLYVVPHPDDDVLGAGGTCALHVEQGDPVHVVVAYDGTAGDPDGRHAREELRTLRQREARAGGRHLGLTDYEFWDYPEGHLPGPGELSGAAERLAGVVQAFAPTIVYAPWVGEQHVDHHVLGRVVRLALARTGFRGQAFGFEVWSALVPTRIVDVSRVLARKRRALEEHQSQLAYHDLLTRGLALGSHRAMFLGKDALHGEGFAPLGLPFGRDRQLV